MDQTSSLTSKLEWALWWASQGFHCFPCLPGAKQPAIRDNLAQATTHKHQICEWWHTWPEANIGCVPGKSGMFVLDVDTKGDGYATLEALEQRNKDVLPGTLTISTPSGGAHFWFRGEAATTARKLGPGLDTRGSAGYVLLPGSILDEGGPYRVVDDASPQPAPRWLSAALAPTQKSETSIQNEEDSPTNVARAAAFLERAKVAVEGQGGNTLTYETAGWVRDFGISQDKALELLLPWNDRCEPPWEEEELAQIVENAYNYAQNEAGSKALPEPKQVFASVELATQPASSSFKYKLRSMKEARERPEPQWIVPGRWPRDALAFVYGPPDSYKSFNVLSDVLGMAYAGERVIYIAGEGAHGVDKKRVPAWQQAHFKTDDATFMTLDTMPPARSVPELERFCRDVQGQGFEPTVIVIDTNARFMAGLNENDAKDAGLVIEALDGIRRSFPGALLIDIAHSGKESERGMRGSSALLGGADVVYRVEADRDTLAIKIKCEKMKDAEPPELLFREGRVAHGSLVFFDVDLATYRKATADEGHSWKAAARSLARLNIPYVSTDVLAADILSDLAEEVDPEELEKRKKSLAKELKRMAPGPLSAYVLSEPSARDIRWGIRIDA